jgi:hypothetical protein
LYADCYYKALEEERKDELNDEGGGGSNHNNNNNNKKSSKNKYGRGGQGSGQGKGGVTFQVFLKVADDWRLWTRISNYPSSILASAGSAANRSITKTYDANANENENDGKLSTHSEKQRQSHQIGALIHLTNQLLSPKFDALELTLPPQTRSSFAASRRQVDDLLEFCHQKQTIGGGVGGFGGIDGAAPLAAWRRLMMVCQRLRVASLEEGGEDTHRSIENSGTVPFDVIRSIQKEVNLNVALISRGFEGDDRTEAFDLLKRNCAASRIVAFFRRYNDELLRHR